MVSFANQIGGACIGIMISTSAGAAEKIINPADFPNMRDTARSSFLALDLETGERCLLAGSDLQTRHAPWSTFKIPNFLIALETGAVSGPDHWLDWDSNQRPAAAYWPDSWRQGQTLVTAYRRSAIWYFQHIASQVGGPAYRRQLDQWNYGNASAPDGSESFWLGGPLLISVEEQVAFVGRLVSHDLGVSAASISALEGASLFAEHGRITLHGKTGSGPVVPGAFSGGFEGWFVGWAKKDDATPIVFAHHVIGDSYDAINEYRRDFAVSAVSACGFIPDSFAP